MPAVGFQIKPCLRDLDDAFISGTRRQINDCHRAVVDSGLDHAKTVVAAQLRKTLNRGCHCHVDIADQRPPVRTAIQPVTGKPVTHRATDYAGFEPACPGKREQATRQRRHRKSGGALFIRRHLSLR